MEWIPALVGAVCGVVVGVSVARAIALGRERRAAERAAATGVELAQLHERLVAGDQRLAALQERLAAVEQERDHQRAGREAGAAELAALRTRLEAERRHSEDKLVLLRDAEAALKEQFKLLASEILEGKTRQLGEQHHQRLDQLLAPFKERIGRFEQQVRETYDREAQDRSALRAELQKLGELGLRMSADATNLTQALKGGSKARGDWGELVLETLLERSGLEKGREYRTQSGFSDERGRRLRPDVVVQLPENRALVIDSKVSLAAWSAYCEAEDEVTGEAAAKALVQSVRTHLRELSAKRYHDLLGAESPDFVLMFVPIEPAFALACQHDPQLFQDAFEQHVVVVGPTTLLATLRTVGNIWRYERQNANALEIARVAGRLYDKFVGFAADLDQIGERLRQTQQAHEAAVGKLRSGRGNIVSRITRLRHLGATTAKKLGTDWTDADESHFELEVGEASDPDDEFDQGDDEGESLVLDGRGGGAA